MEKKALLLLSSKQIEEIYNVQYSITEKVMHFIDSYGTVETRDNLRSMFNYAILFNDCGISKEHIKELYETYIIIDDFLQMLERKESQLTNEGLYFPLLQYHFTEQSQQIKNTTFNLN